MHLCIYLVYMHIHSAGGRGREREREQRQREGEGICRIRDLIGIWVFRSVRSDKAGAL